VPPLRALGEGGDAEAAETLTRLQPRPHRLEHSDDQTSAESVWDDPELLLSQICGQPLTARSTRVGSPSLAAIATPRYTHAGCDGQPVYRGFVVVRAREKQLGGSGGSIEPPGPQPLEPPGPQLVGLLLNPLGRLQVRTPIPFIWRILSAFLRA
jgi:hypothetical protein